MEEEGLWETAHKMYTLAWEYYMFQVACISREDYERMQENIGYTETYLQHMNRLTQGIPANAARIVTQIQQFLTKYPEFQREEYFSAMKMMLEGLKQDPETHKRQALERLIKEKTGEAGPEMDFHPPIFETSIGDKNFVLPTYGNPMMTALYCVLFVCLGKFVSLEQQSPAESHEYV